MQRDLPGRFGSAIDAIAAAVRGSCAFHARTSDSNSAIRSSVNGLSASGKSRPVGRSTYAHSAAAMWSDVAR
ncbi:MAG TPA: hypothetical protein VFL28_01875 [bacterium]|nr:hypothetical protein [bacterium]